MYGRRRLYMTGPKMMFGTLIIYLIMTIIVYTIFILWLD